MATVNEEDRDVARDALYNHVNTASAVAAYRERIEERVRAECDGAAGAWRMWAFEEACVDGPVMYSDETLRANIVKRIAELEAHLNVAHEYNRTTLHKRNERIAELEAQLSNALDPSHYSSKDGRIRDLESALRFERIDCDEWRVWARRLTGFEKGSHDGGLRSSIDSKIAELEAQLGAKHAKLVEVADKLAAAKPVLTAEDERTMQVWRGGTGPSGALVAIIDRLCPPPKAPPTDAELIEILHNGLPMNEANGPHHLKSIEAMFEAIAILRARGAK